MSELRFKLKLLGAFGLFAPDGSRIAISSKKGIALIALVAMARSGERSRAWLQNQLWGSRAPDQASASLRRELANLRIAVNHPAGCELIRTDTQRVWLDLDRIDVDVRTLDHDVSNARASDVGEDGELLEGLDLADAEAFEDWLREQRQQVDEMVGRLREQAWDRAALGIADPADRAHASLDGFAPPPLRPSVAVVPFTCQSAGPDDAAMAQAMSEDLSDALARFSHLRVVGAGADEDGCDPARLCREIGVRYLLLGTIRRDRDRLLIVARLIDGIVGEQLWADRFEAPVTDIFTVQASVAGSVAQHIDSSIDIAERRRATLQPVQALDAYHLYWRANAAFRKWESPAMAEAVDLAEQLLAIEPNNSWASALAAFCHAMRLHFGWADDRAATLASARRHYDHAMAHGGDDPFVMGYAAGALVGMGGDVAIAERLIDRALGLHPQSSSNLFWGGWIALAAGKTPLAVERFDAMLECNPRSAVRPLAMTGRGLALLALGKPDEALAGFREAAAFLSHHPLTVAGLALAHMMTGELDLARNWAHRLQALGPLPTFGALGDPRAQAAIAMLVARPAPSPSDAEPTA